MAYLFESYVAVRDFLELGGPVLKVIVVAIFLLWTLILERGIYLRRRLPVVAREVVAAWEAREDHGSWRAHRIREMLISRLKEDAGMSIPLIKTLVAICPLLGLLGTVTGMIEIFDVLAISGTGTARSMADGVAKATVPTMAGMVGALSGVFASTILARMAAREVQKFNERLELDI